MTPQDITAYLHAHIPMTAAIGAEVVERTPTSIIVRAPLAPNLNHRNTAFGGSLSTLGILSGWAVLNFALRDLALPARLVIQKSDCDFIEPVANEFFAETHLPEPDWTRFVKMLRKHGRARIVAETLIRCDGTEAVTHRGTYVALL